VTKGRFHILRSSLLLLVLGLGAAALPAAHALSHALESHDRTEIQSEAPTVGAECNLCDVILSADDHTAGLLSSVVVEAEFAAVIPAVPYKVSFSLYSGRAPPALL